MAAATQAEAAAAAVYSALDIRSVLPSLFTNGLTDRVKLTTQVLLAFWDQFV